MVLKLLIGLVCILLGAELFTNGVEWLGKKLNLSQSAVGSILAAIGTALPESMIPIVAVFFGTSGEAGNHIGIGAILGAPFMLVTLGLALVGLGSVMFKNRRETGNQVVVNKHQMNRDMGHFIIFYAIAVVGAFLPSGVRPVLSIILILGYVYYAWKTIVGECEGIEDCPPLYLARKNPEPGMFLVVSQVAGALALIIFGAEYFVGGVEQVAVWLDLNPLIVAMILAPVATELPEKLNSIIWMRQSKDILATGNMTGAMVFQSSILPAFGLSFTSWNLEGLSLVNTAIAFTAGVLVWFLNHHYQGKIPGKILMFLSLFYIGFVVLVVQNL